MIGSAPKCFTAVCFAATMIAFIMAFRGFPMIISRQIQSNVMIEESSKMFENWKKTPMPLNFGIYIFNVTNTEEVNAGEKPILQEVGPYVYKQYREKTILGYGENDTIKYTLKKTFIFDQEASGNVSENDDIVVIHLSYMAAIIQVQDIMPVATDLVNGALQQFFSNVTDPFMRVKAKDLFFDGIFVNCSGDHAALSLVCEKIRQDPPRTMRPAEDGTGYIYSMFHHMNNTDLGPFEVVRGTENVKDLGRIVSWEGKKNMMDKWGDKYCGQINGSDGSIFPPIDKDNIPKRLYSFEPDVCRSMYVDFIEERTLFNMRVNYYEVSDSLLASKSANRNNKCFCKRNWSANHDGCLMMGLLNLAPCQGAPVITSFPHFYLASEELLDFVQGLKPEKEKHQTNLYIDPITGVILKGIKRLQFNIELRQVKGIPQLENVPTGLFPLLWIEEGAELPKSFQDDLLKSHKMLGYVEIFRWLFLGIVIAALLISFVMLHRSGALPIWNRNNSVNLMQPGRMMEVNKLH